MKRVICVLLVLFACFSLCCCKDDEKPLYEKEKLYARFMTNCEGQISLTSGYGATGDDVLFACYEVQVGQLLSAPQTQPVREGYTFEGWYTDAQGQNVWDFANTKVSQGVTLFAKWSRTVQSDTPIETYVEPNLTFTETQDASVSGIDVYGVCNFFIENGEVKLPALAINLLSANSGNVKHLLNYKINPSTSITAASYSSTTSKITVKYIIGQGEEQTLFITATDARGSFYVNNGTYDGKAENYENTANLLAQYKVVLAGSSSMEYWRNSTDHLSPITSVNHGIGGTTVEHWVDKLAARLIYAYSPRAVVMYVGVNNIISHNKTGTETGNALKQLFNNIHLHLPNTQVYYVLINLTPDFLRFTEDINVANNMIIEFAKLEGNEWLHIIDAGKPLIKDNGIPNSAYFTDGLHMSESGYILWGDVVRQAIIDSEKELYNID